MEILKFSEEREEKNDLDNLDEELGIVQPIDSPLNLFFNLSNLQDPEAKYIYLYIYSIGKKKIAYYGLYNVAEDRFYLDGGCEYRANDLMRTMQTWKQHNYIYGGNLVENRIKSYSDKSVFTREKYLYYKHLLNYFAQNPQLSFIDTGTTEKLNVTEVMLQEKYGDTVLEDFYVTLLPKSKEGISELDIAAFPESKEFYSVLIEQLKKMKVKIAKYEENLNLKDPGKYGMTRDISIVAANLVAKFHQQLLHDMRSGNIKNTLLSKKIKFSKCPSIEKCHTNTEQECRIYFNGSYLEYLSIHDDRLESGLNPYAPNLL